jgi:hypothetical protein
MPRECTCWSPAYLRSGHAVPRAALTGRALAAPIRPMKAASALPRWRAARAGVDLQARGLSFVASWQANEIPSRQNAGARSLGQKAAGDRWF